MVPTQGGVSFTMLAQPPHLSDICQITHQQL